MKRRDENKWTPEDYERLPAFVEQGKTPEEIADLLHKTPGSVRTVLNVLGLAKMSSGGNGNRRPTRDDSHMRAIASNDAFAAAMRKAGHG